MRLLPITLLLSAFLGFSSSRPIWPITDPEKHIRQAYRELRLHDVQQLFLATPTQSIPPPRRISQPQSPNYRLEAQENSVGVLLSDHDGDLKHFWLPLNQTIYTQDAPALPSRPQTARITTLIHTSPRLAAPEELDRILCEVRTHSRPKTSRGRRVEYRSLSFTKQDGLVRFEDTESPFCLRGQHVESYHCS